MGGDHQSVSDGLSLCILQTGETPAPLRSTHIDYDEMCRALLSIDTEDAPTYRVFDSALPASVDAFGGYLITGSRFGVYDDLDWIAELEAFIRAAYTAGKKMIGICFGHQIIAQALGGKVTKSKNGFGVGVMDYTLLRTGNEPRSIALAALHQDQVIEAPAEAKIIAASDFCTIAGLQYDTRAISFQAHPEFSNAYMHDLIEERRGDVLSDAQADRALASLSTQQQGGEIAALIHDFLKDGAQR